MAIFPFFDEDSVFLSTLVFANTKAGNSSVFSALPPEICSLLMRNLSKSSPPSSSIKASAASNANSVKCEESKESILPCNDVDTTDLFNSLLSAKRAIKSSSLTAFSFAILYPLVIIEGCTPALTNSSAFCNISAINITVVVVPSLADLS